MFMSVSPDVGGACLHADIVPKSRKRAAIKAIPNWEKEVFGLTS